MSAPAGQPHLPRRRHARLCREQMWGVCPDVPDWRCLPMVADGTALPLSQRHVRADGWFGGYRRALHLPGLQVAGGKLTSRLWPELAEYLLAAVLERDGTALRSYCLDLYTPAAPRRLLGVIVKRMALSAGPEGALLRLDLMGRHEEANEALTPDLFDYSGLSPVPFRFRWATVTMDEDVVTDIEQVVITVENHVAAGPSRAGFAAYLAAGVRAVSVELKAPSDSAALRAALRIGDSLGLALELNHPAGHSLDLSLPALQPERVSEQVQPGRLVRETVALAASTDSAGDDITYAVTLNP